LISALFLVLSSCDKLDADSELHGDADLKSGRKVLTFSAHLTGDQEVATIPVETKATGQAIFQLSKDGSELSYKLIVANIENVRMAHIHVAPAGSNGGVVVWLYPSSPPAVTIPGRTDGILAEGIITAANLRGSLDGQQLSDLIALMVDEKTYVNVHTDQYPPGEIRGQIRLNGPKK
jgi:hypothetical protein